MHSSNFKKADIDKYCMIITCIGVTLCKNKAPSMSCCLAQSRSSDLISQINHSGVGITATSSI